MQLLLVITALLCSSGIQAKPSIQVFYPKDTDASSCVGEFSWTKWFNQASPSDNENYDREFLSSIRAANSEDVCERPAGMHGRSVSIPPGITQFTYSWSLRNDIVVGLVSTTPGIDYEVRFCCANTDFITTTTTTTTPRPLTSDTCGRAKIPNSLTFRIFGGSHAIPNSWPWQVLYEERKSCGDNQVCLGLCGGTLIDDRHVLTAAHCIGTTDPTAITITAGLHNKRKSERDTRQVLTVAKIYKHTGYDPVAIENDITILKLTKPVEFNKYVQPACLPGPEPQPDENVVLIGWGALKMNGGAYHELKQTKVKVIGNCENYWGQYDEQKQVCVGDPETGDSACQGDSGGPMLYQHNGQWIVAGIASYVNAKACTTYSDSLPNVYVRVAGYLDWINYMISL